MSLSIDTSFSTVQLLRLQPFTSKRFAALASGQKPLTTTSPASVVINQSQVAQLRRISMTQQNLELGVSYVQTAEGGVDSIKEDLQRMRELAVQAGNDTLSNEDRAAINGEIQSLKENIDQTVTDTTFNGKHPLTETNEVVIATDPRVAVP